MYLYLCGIENLCAHDLFWQFRLIAFSLSFFASFEFTVTYKTSHVIQLLATLDPKWYIDTNTECTEK